MTTRCIVEGGEFESCEMRWIKNGFKGDFDVSPCSKSKLGFDCSGTKCIGDGEGRVRRLLRSKS